MQKPKNKSEAFEKACVEIRKRDLENRVVLKLKGKGRDKAVTLKSNYSSIAAKYLFYEVVGSKRVFSWQQVTDACVLSELYVTDVVSKQL